MSDAVAVCHSSHTAAIRDGGSCAGDSQCLPGAGPPAGRRPLDKKTKSREVRQGADKWELQETAANLVLPFNNRLLACYRAPSGRSPLEVWGGGGQAAVHGVQRCGSVWACPICSAAISERRRGELHPGVTSWVAAGNSVMLVGFTFPHYINDVLKEMLARFGNAQEGLSRNWQGKMVWGKGNIFNIVGKVSALEVKHGRNGWHPHRHLLLFVKGPEVPANLEAIRSLLYEAWTAACESAGLPRPSYENGVDVRNGDFAADYVAKWGHQPHDGTWMASDEVVRGMRKNGKRGESRSPWQLLADANAGDEKSGRLFVEYARCFKGKRQLVWSRGLRKMLGLDVVEKTDQEIVDAPPDETAAGFHCLAPLPPLLWRLVVRLKQRASLLATARAGSADQVREWLYDLRQRGGVFEAEDLQQDPDGVELARVAAARTREPGPHEDLFAAFE